jgi:hypothetical protein
MHAVNLYLLWVGSEYADYVWRMDIYQSVSKLLWEAIQQLLWRQLYTFGLKRHKNSPKHQNTILNIPKESSELPESTQKRQLN